MTDQEKKIIEKIHEISRLVFPLFMQPAEAAEDIVRKRKILISKLEKVIHDEFGN